MEIAERFSVSTAWIRRLLQRRRETGAYGPKTTKRGRKPAFSGASLERLDHWVEAQADAALAELRNRCGVSCSLVTVSNTLARLGYRRKQRRSERLSKTVPT